MNKPEKLLLGLPIVGALHVGIGFFLYPHTRLVANDVLEVIIDMVRAFLPIGFAIAGYFWVFWNTALLSSKRKIWRIIVASVVALAAVFVSETVIIGILITKYGS